MTPKVTTIRQDDSHRLIPCRDGDQSALERLTEDPDELSDLFELDGATKTGDRLIERLSLVYE